MYASSSRVTSSPAVRNALIQKQGKDIIKKCTSFISRYNRGDSIPQEDLGRIIQASGRLQKLINEDPNVSKYLSKYSISRTSKKTNSWWFAVAILFFIVAMALLGFLLWFFVFRKKESFVLEEQKIV
jgi:hypothetical protein